MVRITGLLLFLVLAACGGGGAEQAVTTPAVPTSTSSPEAAGCADVVDVEVITEGSGTYRFAVTVASPDTGWEKYADAWELRAPDGTVLGTRVLAHPHVDEQPFTRSLSDVAIPAGIEEVEVAARDLVEGFCGETMVAAVPTP